MIKTKFTNFKKILIVVLSSFVLFLLTMFVTTKEANIVNAETATPNYLTFTVKDGTARIYFNGFADDGSMEYRINDGEWANYSSGLAKDLSSNDYIQFRGENVSTYRADNPDTFNPDIYFQDKGFGMIAITEGATVEASGDVTSLVNKIGGDAELTIDYQFAYLFYNCDILTTAPNLPSTTLSKDCYNSMFRLCENLTEAPSLLATTLTEGCYKLMFSNCKKITATPSLPATTLADECYKCMFLTCTNLTTVSDLPAKTLAKQCYNGMFRLCSKIEKAPNIQATTFADECCSDMFYDCTNLTEASITLPEELPSTSCSYMFHNCTSLTKAPNFSSVKIFGESCCSHMFSNCTSLTEVSSFSSAETFGKYCCFNMFYNCTSLTKAPSFSSVETFGKNCCYYMFGNCTSLTEASITLPEELPYESCYGMFYNCTSLTIAPNFSSVKIFGESCCGHMFENCSSLYSVADLSNATSFGTNCCYYMYSNCKKINVFYDNQDTRASDYTYLGPSYIYTNEWVVPDVTYGTNWSFYMFGNCGNYNCGNTALISTGKKYYLINPEYIRKSSTFEFTNNGNPNSWDSQPADYYINGDTLTFTLNNTNGSGKLSIYLNGNDSSNLIWNNVDSGQTSYTHTVTNDCAYLRFTTTNNVDTIVYIFDHPYTQSIITYIDGSGNEIIKPFNKDEGLLSLDDTDDYDFMGWTFESDCSGNAYKRKQLTTVDLYKDTTLYSKWSKSYIFYDDSNWNKNSGEVFNEGDEITILFDNDYGCYTYQVIVNNEIVKEAQFEKLEYSYTFKNNGGYVSELNFNEDKPCAYIKIVDLNFKYNINGGTGTTPTHSASNVTVNDGTTTITLEDYSGFYKSGYSFVGWSKDENATSGIISEYTINNEDSNYLVDVVFYAIWEKLDGIYWSNNDGLTTDCPTLFDAKLSDKINYSFLYKETSDSEGTNQGITITISPQFTVFDTKTRNYITTYTNNINGLIQTAGDYVITVNYKDESLSIDITKTFTLHVQSSLTFNELKINGMTMPDNIYGDVGEVVTIPTDTSTYGKEHYTFDHWNTKDDGTGTNYYPGDSITLGTKVFALFPVWDCDGFVVTYDLNGGESEEIIDDNAYAEGDDVTITSIAPTRDGYIFVCWNTKKDRSGINYNADTTYKMSNQDVTFYAVWSHVCNDIVFDKVFNSSALNGNAILGGNYYLEEDIIIDGDHGFGTYGETITISGYDTVNICLNGHILQFNELAFEIKGTLNIYDCDDTEHKFSVDSNGRWVADEENGTKTSTGAYITYSGESLTYPLFYIRSGGNLALHDVDIIGVNANFSIIYATYGKNTITLDNGTNIIGNCCNNLDYLIDIRNNTDYEVTINLSDVTISYNVSNNPISLYGSGKITTNIGDNVVIKNNVQKYGENLSTGLTLRTYYMQANSMNAFSPLTIKDGVKGTAIDITVLLDFSDYLDHDAIITTGNNSNVSDIFTLTTYAYDGRATVIDNRYVIRNIVDESINKVYISRWYTITYANRIDIALLKSVGTVSDSTHYFYGDKVTIKDTTGLTVQDRYLYSDLDWYDASYTFLGWTTNGSAYSLSYSTSYSFYEKNGETTYNFTSGNYGIADNVTLYPTAIPNTLYYSINDGKFHYQDPTSSFIATVLDDMYVAEKDSNGYYTIITFNNLNYSTDYVHAIEINTTTEEVNITFKGTNTVTSAGWCAFNFGSDKVVFNIEGTLNVNGGLLFSALVVNGEGVMNISSSTAINSACSGINGSSLKVEGNAVVYIENTVDNDEYYSFKLDAFDNTVVYAKENKNDDYVVYGDFYNNNGRILSSRDVDDNLIYYDYIKITSYSVEEPNASNNYKASPNVESDYQWYEEKEGLEPLTIDVIVDAMVSDATFDPITITSLENMIMLAYGSNCVYNALVFKSTTDVDYSLDSNLEAVYEEYKQILGLYLMSKTYDSATGEYTYKINIQYVADIGGYASLFITPENTVIYDIYLVSNYNAIDGANSSTYEPTSSGNYMVKTSVSYAGYTSDTIVASEVKFDSNGGSGSMNNIVKFSGLSTTLPTIAFAKSNYRFIGWTTIENGTTVEYIDGSNFTFGDNDVTLYAIWEAKTTIEINETSQEVTYNTNSQEFELKGTHKDAGSFIIEYKVNNTWTTTAPTNAGTYDVKITRSEDDTYASYSKEINSGLVINKAKVTKPTEDTTTFVYNGSEQQYNLTSSSLYTISNDKKTTPGTQTVKVALNDKDNYAWNDETSADLEFTFTIVKATYDMSNAKWNYTDAFTYDGNEHKVEVTNLPSGVTVKSYDDNAKTESGKYTAKVIFEYDSTNYNEPVLADLTWEIKSQQITPSKEETSETSKDEVIVSTEEGFSSSITVTVEVTVEAKVKEADLTVDYYNLENKDIKLDKNEVVGVVYDVKLIQTIDGVSRVIQPSDIKEGTKIKVRMLIPEDVDVSKLTKILHVHSADDIEVIEFDSSKLVDGYYEIEVDKLSEFAFVYKNSSNYIWIIIVAAIIIALIILFIILRNRKDKDDSKKETKERSLHDSIVDAGIINSKCDVNKKAVADYLEDIFKDEVICNRRANYISNGYLPLADTHYKVNGKKKQCFVYVYELRNNKVFFLVKVNDKLATKLSKKYSGFTKSSFPKNKANNWYSLVLDKSFKSNKEVLNILKDIFENI